jgi:hypothetical protein
MKNTAWARPILAALAGTLLAISVDTANDLETDQFDGIDELPFLFVFVFPLFLVEAFVVSLWARSQAAASLRHRTAFGAAGGIGLIALLLMLNRAEWTWHLWSPFFAGALVGWMASRSAPSRQARNSSREP